MWLEVGQNSKYCKCCNELFKRLLRLVIGAILDSTDNVQRCRLVWQASVHCRHGLEWLWWQGGLLTQHVVGPAILTIPPSYVAELIVSVQTRIREEILCLSMAPVDTFFSWSLLRFCFIWKLIGLGLNHEKLPIVPTVLHLTPGWSGKNMVHLMMDAKLVQEVANPLLLWFQHSMALPHTPRKQTHIFPSLSLKTHSLNISGTVALRRLEPKSRYLPSSSPSSDIIALRMHRQNYINIVSQNCNS